MSASTAPIIHESTTHLTLDGKPAVLVPLVGMHGTGREMLLDRDVYRRLASIGGHDRCIVVKPFWRRPFVRHPHLGKLARWIVDAPRGEQTVSVNGDPLDLRRCNLNLAREAAIVRATSTRAPRDTQKVHAVTTMVFVRSSLGAAVNAG